MSLAGAHQEFRIIVCQSPEEIFIHIAITVSLPGKNHYVESLIGSNQCIYNPDGIGWIYIVVNVPGAEHQMAFQVLGDGLVRIDMVNK